MTTERSEEKDGWNRCVIDIGKRASVIEGWLDGLASRIIELITDDTLHISIQEDGPQLYVLCNDLFYWGCSDGEDFDVSDLPDLEKALKDTPKNGDILWCCRKRKMRPQKPYYEYFSKAEAKIFDGCGPERDE